MPTLKDLELAKLELKQWEAVANSENQPMPVRAAAIRWIEDLRKEIRSMETSRELSDHPIRGQVLERPLCVSVPCGCVLSTYEALRTETELKLKTAGDDLPFPICPRCHLSIVDTEVRMYPSPVQGNLAAKEKPKEAKKKEKEETDTCKGKRPTEKPPQLENPSILQPRKRRIARQ